MITNPLRLLYGLAAILSLTTATPLPTDPEDRSLSAPFHLRVDRTHPSPLLRSYGYLTSLSNLEPYSRDPNPIFDNLPPVEIPFSEQVPLSRNSSTSPSEPRFTGAFTKGWWSNLGPGDTLVDAAQEPSHQRQYGRRHLRLKPSLLESRNRSREWDQWYYPNQQQLDFSPRNEYYRLYGNTGTGKGDYYGCTNQYSATGGCWLQTGFTVADTVDEAGDERHWLGYTGLWENMWALCRNWSPGYKSESYSYEAYHYYQLRLVNGKTMENCTEPFSLEVEYIKEN